MAKTDTYCITYQGILEKPQGAEHYTVYKVDEDEPPEMASVYDVVLRGDTRTCNCPGFTYHNSANARGPQHKHFRLVQFFKDNYDSERDGSVPSMFIDMGRSSGELTRGSNPFSDAGLPDNFEE